MNNEEAAELHLLTTRTRPDGTVRFGTATLLAAPMQNALERLTVRGFLRLIDVVLEENGSGRLVRVFQVTEEARRWLGRVQSAKSAGKR